MDKRVLATLLSSLISQLIPLLLLFISPPSGDSFSLPFNSLSPLITHLLTISQTAATLKRKRSKSHPQEINTPLTKLSRKGRVLTHSAIPRNPESFKLCFKMTSSSFEWLSALLEPLLECRDPVNSPLNLPVETRLGIGLYRLATGSGYHDISQRFHVSETVAKFCVKQLCRVLCTDFRFWVGFPTGNELDPVTESFQTLTGLPNCCGVVHCTRFSVLKTGYSEEVEDSIAAQIVVDSSSKILSVVAGFNGEKGNEVVLKSTTLYKDIVSNKLLNAPPIDINGVLIPQYLIGEKGYPFLPWLMVPFHQPVMNSYEEKFNSAHNLMLASGFRTIDSLKKWGVLSKPIKEEIKTVVAYIGACSILHNALLMREDYSSLSGESDEFFRCSDSSQGHNDANIFVDNSIDQKAFEIRSALATRARRC